MEAKHCGWSVKDAPGVMIEIPKQTLVVDHDYQRALREAKVTAIAKAWSWIACGAIIVADRGGEYVVVDGQHRVAAAMRRPDIGDLPCLVFPTESIKQEAEGFIAANTQRGALLGVERFRGLVMAGDPHALFVKDMIDRSGRVVTTSGAANGIRCVMGLMALAKTAPAELQRLWPLVNELTEGHVFDERILQGLIYIERRMPSGASLADSRWRNRLLTVGYRRLLDGAIDGARFFKKGGQRAWGNGMLAAINYRSRAPLKIIEEAAP